MNNTQEYFIQPDAIKDGSIELKKLTACKDISALGEYSTALGIGTITNNEAEHASGKYNVSNDGSTIFSVGIGTSDTSRKNALEIQYGDNGKTIINTPVNILGDVKITGDLITDGTHIINNVTEQNELEVTGETVLMGTLDVSGMTTINNSLLVGIGLSAKNDYEVALGRYNNSISGETLFSIGNGTQESKSNIFEIQNTGIAYLNNKQIATQEWVKTEFANNETIESLTATIGTLETTINGLKDQLNAAITKITALEEDIAALENDLAEISEEK